MRVLIGLRTWTCVLAVCTLAGTPPGLAQPGRSGNGRSRLALSGTYTRLIDPYGREIFVPVFNVPGLLPDAASRLLHAWLCRESEDGSNDRQFWERCREEKKVAEWEHAVGLTTPSPRKTAKALLDVGLFSSCGARYFIQWFNTPGDETPAFVSSSFSLKGSATCL